MPRLGAPIVPPGPLPAQPQLTSPGGLVLRSWRPDAAGDVAAVLEAFADPEIQRWGVRNISTADQARVWMTRWTTAWRAETDACWAVLRDGMLHVDGWHDVHLHARVAPPL